MREMRYAIGLAAAAVIVVMALNVLIRKVEGQTVISPADNTSNIESNERTPTPSGEIPDEYPEQNSLFPVVGQADTENPISPLSEVKLAASDGAANHRFSESIAIYGDTIVVGAPGSSVGGVNQGAAYVYVRDGSNWVLQQKLTASDGAVGDRFGTAVAIFGDTVIVGAPFDDVGSTSTNHGSAYVFVRNGTNWTEVQHLIPSNSQLDAHFGFSVALYGDKMVIGAPRHIQTIINPQRRTGVAYSFIKSGASWVEQQILTPSDSTLDNERFGDRVTMSSDTVVVSSPEKSINGNIIQGIVSVFVSNGGSWTEQAVLTANDARNFGRGITITGDVLIVGAPTSTAQFSNQGAAYVFARTGTSWAQQQKLTASDALASAGFGYAVSMIGNTVVIGAWTMNIGANNLQGAAYIFRDNGVSWTQQTRVTAADGAASDRFGSSVGLTDSWVVIGAVEDDIGANGNQGSAYVFNRCEIGARGESAAGAQCESEIIVNTTGDEPDEDTSDTECDVDEASSGLQCTLRAAIRVANDLAGPDTIKFNIPGSGVQTIAPATALPNITSKVTIDGTSQPGYSASPLIEIQGSLAGNGVNGLVFLGASNQSTVKALTINRFEQAGVLFQSSENRIENSWIGLSADGLSAGSPVQGAGVRILSADNHVGGARNGAAANNLIAGNAVAQVFLETLNATRNKIKGNNIGLNVSGIPPEGNFLTGVLLLQAGSNNTIGGNTAADINIITADATGISIDNTEAFDNQNTIAGNRILGCGTGVSIVNSGGNTIGGDFGAGSNHIGGNSSFGITIDDTVDEALAFLVDENKVFGNLIGISPEYQMFGNGTGVGIIKGTNNSIGSGQPQHRNIISENSSAGVGLNPGAKLNLVLGNYVGTNADGTSESGNGSGVMIRGNQNTVAGNLISGNQYGVSVQSFETNPAPLGNTVQSNRIGLAASGDEEISNQIGVFLLEGKTIVTGNTISGNTAEGILILSNENTITSNMIGTDVTGNSAVGNGDGGVRIAGTLNTVIGNTISGNKNGVNITRAIPNEPIPTNNVVQGNFIGTNATGTAPVPNTENGVEVGNNAIDNKIGGLTSGAGNIISGNGMAGILVQHLGGGGAIAPFETKIQGNSIGTDPSGTAAIPNTGSGVYIRGGISTRVGGTGSDMPAARNIISGNGGDGIRIADNGIVNRITGNYIGVAADGVSALGNTGNGVTIASGSASNIIGGPETNAGNTIAFNANGVVLSPDAVAGNLIYPKRNYDNALLGIDLGGDGVTPNDPADADVGPNKLQNYPTFVFSISGGNLIVNYKVDSAPENSAYGTNGIYVEFFEADSTGAGRDFLGSDSYLLSDYSSGSPGSRKKNLGNAAALGFAEGDTMTATATDADGNSSEFTPPVSSAPSFISGTVTYANAIPASTRFVSNVLISGAGSQNVSTTTAAPGAIAGQYTLMGFGSGSYSVSPSKTGGVNNITSFDAARISQHVAGPPNPQLTGNQLIVADVSGNTSVTSFDAAMIAKFVAGPPYASPGIGSTATWRFTPANRNYASVTSSISGEDYSALLMGEVSGNWNNTGTRPAGRVESGKLKVDREDGGPERGIAVALPTLVASSDKEILVPVNVQGIANKGVISYEFDLRYDASVIQPLVDPVDVKDTASRGLSVVTNAAEPGLLRVVVYGAFPIDENGVMLNLRFTAVGGAGSVSPILFERIMFNEGEPRVSIADGKVELF